MVHDFQVLMDQNGTILHFDLDRIHRNDFEIKDPEKAEQKRKFALFGLKVIAMKVLAAVVEGGGDVTEEQLATAREYSERARGKLC